MAGSLSVRKKNAEAAQKRRVEQMKVERRRANEAATSNTGKLGSGIASIPGRVVNYIKSSTPSSVGRDVKGIARATYDAAVEDPNAFIEDAIFSPLAAIRDFGDVRAPARKLRAQGRNAEAEKMEALAGTAVLSAVPILGRPAGVATRKAIKAVEKTAVKGATKKAAEMAVTPKPKQLALPAPPKQLALPAPGPGLPSFAVKPRGGQWWADKNIIHGNNSPEAAARQSASYLDTIVEGFGEADRPFASADLTSAPVWLQRALTKYLKNDFGTPEDPLRDLAARGLHYDAHVTPEQWQRTVNSTLIKSPIGDVLFPPNSAGGMPGAGSDLRGEAMTAMPWLAKLPVTDNIYGIHHQGLNLDHFTDELYNALNAGSAGLPSSLAVRPESLDRMTFAQAAEHVGKINQFRAKEMERVALGNLDSPAVRPFKDYAEDNPMGLRWVQLKAPETKPLPEWGWEDLGDGRYRDQNGAIFTADPDRAGGFKADDDHAAA